MLTYVKFHFGQRFQKRPWSDYSFRVELISSTLVFSAPSIEKQSIY